jgi:DnaK suppressor protein
MAAARRPEHGTIGAVSAKPPRMPPVEPKPPKPGKPLVDPELLQKMREALVSQRQRLLSVVQTTQAQMAEKSGDLPDVSDRASEGFEDELDMGLMAIEAAQLDDIDAALRRLDEGTYGLCSDCGRAIPRKRLEVLPFVRRCLACEGLNERRARSVEAVADEDEAD